MLESFLQDIGYALRTLRRSPGFTALVVLTLGFGIAANTTVFSVLNPYFLRPLPFTAPGQLAQLGQVDPITGWDGVRFSLPQFLDWRARSRAFEDLGTYTYTSMNLTGTEGPERLMVGIVSSNMFALLGTRPAAGRVFQPGEDGPAASRVTVLGHGLWVRRFGADHGVLGRTLTIDGMPYTVIGIMPPEFVFPCGGVRLWIPFAADPSTEARDRNIHLMVGRLRDGWTAEQARGELTAIQREIAGIYPDAEGRYDGVSVTPIREALNFAWEPLRLTFAIMLAAVALALLLACVNVASLTLARATARGSEVAVRAALGAGQGRLVRQLLTESTLLAVCGGLIGVSIAWWAARAAGSVIPEDLYRIGGFTIDVRVLAFTALVTLTTPIVFGLAPALTASRTDLASTLKEGGRGGSGLRSIRTRRLLVVFEVAMAVVLMAGMALMVQSFRAARTMDLGFTPDRVLTVEVTPPRSEYESEALTSFYTRATEALSALPATTGAGMAAWLPLNHETSMIQFALPGREPATREEWPIALQNITSEGYFAAMRVPLIAGRTFTDRLDLEGSPVVVINRALATRYWSDESPVGQSLSIGDPSTPLTATVIGVVGDVRHEGIVVDIGPQIYRAMTQFPTRRRFLVVATNGSPETLTPSVRQALHGIDPNLPATIRPLRAIVNENLMTWAFPSVALAILGTGALLLASLGIYGVIAYTVVQRHQEIGVRMALGASRQQIRATFLREGVRLTAIGLGFGLIVAAGVGRLIRALLLGVSPFDPLILLAVALMFAVVAALASALPAHRASRVDPQTVLRYE